MNKNSNKALTPLSKGLRKSMTKEEKHLWYDFFKKLGFNVNRQKIIGNYIVDFCIPSVNLIIELDGSQHYTPDCRLYDKQRDGFLMSCGYTVLRYANADVNTNFFGVCEDILKHIKFLKEEQER